VNKLNTVSEIFLDHTLIIERGDGIIEVITSDDFMYERKHIMEIHNALLGLTAGKKRPLMMIGGKKTQISDDAMTFMASEESAETSTAEAFVIQSFFQRILANFYLKVKKPKVPTRFFSNQKKAETWLLMQTAA